MITTQQRSTNFLFMVPVMFSFFVMGFVDLVGIASNYVKADLQLTDSTANIFPSLVFFWFLIFSVPTGLMMNRIGRKRTVLLSLIVTAVALALPLCSHSFAVMLTAFFAFRHWQHTDANFAQPAAQQHGQRQKAFRPCSPSASLSRL